MKPRQVSKIMKTHLNMTFTQIKRVSLPGNSVRCKVLRSLYAQSILPLYKSGRHLINIDESWLGISSFQARSWNFRGEGNTRSDRVLGNKVNLIVAVSSRGFAYLSCTQVMTDEDVIAMFLSRLANCLH